jgi:isocitrate/isopropylmalate dehydrogenase
MTTHHRIVLILGDGIGAEVLLPAQQVLEAVGRIRYDRSCERYLRGGRHDARRRGRGPGHCQPAGRDLVRGHDARTPRPSGGGQGHPDAIASVLAKTDIRTRDLGGTATTAEFTDQLIELL